MTIVYTQCKRKDKKGKRCEHKAIYSFDYCFFHLKGTRRKKDIGHEHKNVTEKNKCRVVIDDYFTGPKKE